VLLSVIGGYAESRIPFLREFSLIRSGISVGLFSLSIQPESSKKGVHHFLGIFSVLDGGLLVQKDTFSTWTAELLYKQGRWTGTIQ
jgi:hypothetical protein